MLKLSSSRGIRIDVPVLSVSWSFEDHSVIIQALRIGLIEHEASDTEGVPRWKSSCPDRLAEATGWILRMLLVLQVFSGSIPLCLEYFGIRYSGILSVLKVLRDAVLLVLWLLAVFRHWVLLLLSILGSVSGIHTARCSNTRSISWFYTARYCWLAYYSGYFTRMLRYFRVQYFGYSDYSIYFICLYCGYCLYSRICTAHTSSTRWI